MKKTYTMIKTFALLLIFAATSVNAQLSGIYTINSASATAGNNFQTFNALKTALVASGVNGPVTVNVIANSGPYIEQVDFPQIVGMSVTNTMTINGNGCTISFQGTSASPWTFDLSGMDYLTVNNLIMTGTDVTYALTCHLWNSSSNNTFNNCVFNCPQNGTSSIQCPFSISGSGTSATSSANSGDNNAAITCTMNSGYYGVAMYGLSTSPYNTNNQIIGCYIQDYYLYGAYNVYQRQIVYRNNTIQRLNRTTLTTTYGILCTTGTYQSLIEGNKIQKLFEANPGFSATAYLLYMSASSALGFESQIRNNLVSLDKMVGTVYGIYNPSYTYNNFYHNTISIDNQNDVGALTVYAIYMYGTFTNVKNNNVSITRPGTGTRYGLYYASTISAGCSNGNNVWLSNSGSTNYYGYNSSTATSALTLATWSTATGLDNASFQTDPLFVNPIIGNYIPASYVMNNGGQVLNVAIDITGLNRSLVTPDPGAYEYFNTPCTGAPIANAVITPTGFVCPNSPVNVYMANSYTTSGNTYQWQTSTVSAVGPFQAVPTGTNAALNATVGSSVIYYSAIVTCTNSNSNITAVSGSVNVAGTTTSSVPYNEGFEGISANGKLPNCSWSASSINNTCFTYTAPQTALRIARTGTKFANFYYTPAGSNFFWSNGIQLQAGVTYSASMWYLTDVNNYTNWNLKMWLGTGQTTAGATTIATTGSVAASQIYTPLSNTFVVATSGLYYVGINGISTGGSGLYLTWDDLQIIAPCQMNTPPMVLTTNGANICQGQSVNLAAIGADTYSWSTGATSSGITVTPTVSTVYSVVGTSSASGCGATASQMINVNPTPQVYITSPTNSVCAGGALVLTANSFGAVSYTWNTNSNATSITVGPQASTGYSVIGSSAAGCLGIGSMQVIVNPIPVVSVLSSNPEDLACADDETTLTGSGAASYQWLSGNTLLLGNPVNVSPNSYTTYTLIGYSAAGCSNTAVYDLFVTQCVGLNQLSTGNSEVKLYPNPSNGQFTIEWNNGFTKSVEITDISGRVIYTASSEMDAVNMNLTDMSNGVYFVKIKSNGSTEMIRFVKE